jgi:alpha-beta hydrolase superfamily lysophospholipase
MNAAPLAARDGTPLHLREWRVSAPRGTVLVVHGLGEHIGRYEHVAARLNAAGWNVAGHDQRGHGASGGPRGAIARDDDLLADLAVVIDALRARGTAGPLVLLGHSMGGLVAARFALGTLRAAGSRDDDAGGPAAEAAAEPWARDLDALVLSSPALDPGMNALQKALLAVLGPLAPDLAIGNGLKPAWISRDPQVVRAYERDPLVHDRITPRLVRFIVDAGLAVRAAAPCWRVPTLLMWAGADRCVAPAGSAAFAAAAPRGVVAAREFPALFHEIFNEPERDEPLRLLTDWLAARASASAVA